MSACNAEIALRYEGEVNTNAFFGERSSEKPNKFAYVICDGCSIDREFPIVSEADVEVFLTENCQKNLSGEYIMIK